MINYSQTIYNLLSTDEEIQSLVEGQIYPLILPENATFPNILFTRNFTCDYTKDWRTGSNLDIQVIVFDLDYKQTITIAEAIDRVFTANNIRLTSCQEEYREGAFMQLMNYSVQVRG